MYTKQIQINSNIIRKKIDEWFLAGVFVLKHFPLKMYNHNMEYKVSSKIYFCVVKLPIWY